MMKRRTPAGLSRAGTTGLEPNWLDRRRRTIATRCSRVLSASPRACRIYRSNRSSSASICPMWLARLCDSAAGPQGRQQMHQRRPVLVHEPTNRLRTVAPRQMLGQIPSHRVLIEPLQAEPLPAHPVGEVRDADEIDAPGARRVAPRPRYAQYPVTCASRALCFSHARVCGCKGKLVIHHDRPSRDWSRAEDQEDYAQFDACSASHTGLSTGDSAQAGAATAHNPNVRIVSSQSHRPDLVFRGIVAELEPAIIEVAAERIPPPAGIADGTGEIALARDLLQLRIEPDAELVDPRLRHALAHASATLGRRARNQPLDVEQRADPIECLFGDRRAIGFVHVEEAIAATCAQQATSATRGGPCS